MSGPTRGKAGARRARGGSAQAYVAYGLGSALRFLVQLAFSRMLGVTDFGRFVVARTWAETLGSFADRGHGAAMVRTLPELEQQRRAASYRAVLRRGVLATVIGGVVVAVVAIAVVRLLAPDDTALAVGLGLVPLLAVVRLLRSPLIAQHRLQLAMGISEVLQPVLLIAIAAATFLAVRGTAEWALVVLGISLALTVAVQAWAIGRGLPTAVDGEVGRPATLNPPGMLGPMFVVQSTVIVYAAADVLIADLVAGPAAAGVYAVALRVAGLVRNINNVVEQSAAPRLAAAHARGDREALQGIVDRSISRSLVFTLVAAGGIAAVGWPVLRVFGPEFTAGYTPLLLLLLADVCASSTGPSGNVLLMTDAHRAFAVIQAVLVGAHIPLTWVLTSWFGLTGTASATVVITATTNVAIAVTARRLRDLDVVPRPAHLREGAGVIAALVRTALRRLS